MGSFPGRMDRLVLAEIAGPFIFGVLMFTSLFFAGGEFLRIAEFIGRGVSLELVGRLLVLSLPYLLAMTFPMAMLLAALLGFGRLSNDSEIVALVATGVSFGRIVLPLGIFSFLIALLGFWFADAVVPAADREREAIIDRVQSGGIGAAANIRGFTFPVQQGDTLTVVRVQGGLDLASGVLRNVSVEHWENSLRVTRFIYADRARWIVGTDNWELENAVVATLQPGENNSVATFRSGQTIEGVGPPTEVQALEGEPKELSIARLRERIRTLGRSPAAQAEARKAEVEIARRVALPMAAFVFALVGAPLGVRPQRQGKGVGFGLAILIIFGYYIAFQFLSFLGQSGTLPALLALNIPNIAGFLAAVFLIRRVFAVK